MFFLHKGKGSKSEPGNYRSINVQNPLMKIFCSILASRLSEFAEMTNLLPCFQFGFRRKRSTISAAALLHEVVDTRLKAGQRTYACFVDFSKAFDKIDRTLLFNKLQRMAIPFKFCSILFNIFNQTRIFIQSGNSLSKPFSSNIGTPQGDSIAAILFSLFLSDLEYSLPDIGPMLNGIRISAIMYADDIVLLAENAADLQKMLTVLHGYCLENKLEVNVGKTKCMIFHRGRCPAASFTYSGNKIDIVKSFTYLGFVYTVQLAFSQHVEKLIAKGRSRIGQLYARLPLTNLSLELVLKVFHLYVTPIFLYGLAMYFPKCSNSSKQAMDALFTKFIKRYLQIPPWSNNAVTYFITETIPFSSFLAMRTTQQFTGLVFPQCLSGLKISFLSQLNDSPSSTNFNSIQNIPSSFWCSRTFTKLPSNAFYRKQLTHEIYDMHHRELCGVQAFHKFYEPTCICLSCGEHAHPYHERYCQPKEI